MPKLVVNPDSPEAWLIELRPGTISLGRSEQSDFPIEHPSVSSSHCQITLSGDSVLLKDLGSTAGTFVNDELVEEAKLQPGQLLRLGDVVMRFESHVDAAQLSRIDPPIPPRMGRAAIPSSSRCKFHPQIPAHFSCPKCQHTFCPLCVATRLVHGVTHRFCRHCGSECQPLQPGRNEPKPAPGFFASLPHAFLYPFQGSGFILLIAGTAFFYLLGRLPIIGLLVTGYLFAYAKSIITSTANGQKEPPDWPDFTDWKEDILVPYVQLVALILVCFGPAFIIALWHPGNETQARIAYFAALGFGALLAPMGMLALAMFDTLTVLNPIALAWSIVRVPLHYFVAAAAFEIVLVLYWFAGGVLRGVLPVPFLPDIISSFLNLYVTSVGMRILGLLYASNQDEFGWFSRLRS